MMKRFLALCVFWPMLAVLIALAGLVAVLRGSERLLGVVADWATPLVLALAEVADGETKN
jgi:hypothetical protein